MKAHTFPPLPDPFRKITVKSKSWDILYAPVDEELNISCVTDRKTGDTFLLVPPNVYMSLLMTPQQETLNTLVEKAQEICEELSEGEDLVSSIWKDCAETFRDELVSFITSNSSKIK